MKNKGFTLTELLVVVVILGIITGISVPLIRGLTTTFEKKKYNNYADSLLSASKLFNDSYSEDLFGHNEYGCAYITYDQLVEKNLLKDIQIDGISCNSDKTYVRVVKQKDKYGYASFLSCGKKTDGKVTEVSTTIPSAIPDIDIDSCTGVDPSNIVISATPDKSEAFDKKRKSTKLTLTSYTGIDNNVVIYTKWSKDPNGYNFNDGWERTTFKIVGNQQSILLDGNPITSTSKQLTTPAGGAEVDGSWILFVRVDQLQDLYGNKWKNPSDENSKIISFRNYNVDTIPPTISNLAVNSTVSGYNANTVKVTFTGSDNHTATEDLKMCITTDANGCKNASNFERYNSSKNITIPISGSANKTIYVHLKDKTGNVVTQTKSYTLQGRVKVYDYYCNHDGTSCGGNTCDQYGKNCTTIANKTRTLVGTYNTTVKIDPQNVGGYTNSASYTATYNGDHQMHFYHTRTLSYANVGNGSNVSGYSYSGSDDNGITFNYSGGGTLQIWPAGIHGAGEGPYSNVGSGSRINYSSIGDNGDATHRHQKGTFFIRSDASGAGTVVLRPYIRLTYNYSGFGDQIKKPHTEVVIRSGATKNGYTFRTWQLYSYSRDNVKTACKVMDGSGWNLYSYYPGGHKLTKEAWNISNSSFPCALNYSYKDRAGDMTIYLEPIWQKNAWAKYDNRVVNGVAR